MKREVLQVKRWDIGQRSVTPCKEVNISRAKWMTKQASAQLRYLLAPVPIQLHFNVKYPAPVLSLQWLHRWCVLHHLYSFFFRLCLSLFVRTIYDADLFIVNRDTTVRSSAPTLSLEVFWSSPSDPSHIRFLPKFLGYISGSAPAPRALNLTLLRLRF